MAYWLFKSEPDVFSFDDLIAKGDAGEEWDGVRNYQARNNMRAMKKGDRGPPTLCLNKDARLRFGLTPTKNKCGCRVLPAGRESAW